MPGIILDEVTASNVSHTEQSLKLVDKSEEQEDGATVICEKERFSNELMLVFCNGEIAILK
jgi:hypothetical protein